MVAVCRNIYQISPECPISNDGNGPMATRQTELAREQEYGSRRYERLDLLRERTQKQLKDVLPTGAAGTLQNRSQRDRFAGMYAASPARPGALPRCLAS